MPDQAVLLALDAPQMVMCVGFAACSQDWGDVYYFCGKSLQYCTCNFRWNALGWLKAGILWNFILSAALGLQRLAIQIGLTGLLPGKLNCMTLPTACSAVRRG